MSRLLLTEPLPVHQYVESVVMSRFFQRGSQADYEAFGVQWDAKQRELISLSAAEQFALLDIRRSDLSRMVVDKLRSSTVRASPHDYDSLIRKGLAYHQGGKLIISYVGKLRADRIANESAKTLELHFFTRGFGRFETYVACSCGWNYHHSRNEGHERSAFSKRMGQHLREVGQAKASVVAGAVVVVKAPAAKEGATT